MVHTAELITAISEREYRMLKAAGTATYTGKGIRKINLIRPQYAPKLYYCKIVLNLNRVANMGIITPTPFMVTKTNAEKLANGFSVIMSQILPVRANINSWWVTRIDYTRDIKTGLVKEYITLLQRGGKPPFMSIDNQSQHRKELDKTHYDGAIRYHSKSVIINIYDKYKERKNVKDYPPKLLEQCKNLLRVEIQCLRAKKNRIRRAHGINGNTLFDLLLTEKEQEKMIVKYLTAIAGTHDYYIQSDADKIIDNSNLTAKGKSELKEFMRTIAKRKSIWKVKHTDKNNRTHVLLAKLKMLNINPVTIPCHWKKRRINSIISLLDNPNIQTDKNGG